MHLATSLLSSSSEPHLSSLPLRPHVDSLNALDGTTETTLRSDQRSSTRPHRRIGQVHCCLAGLSPRALPLQSLPRRTHIHVSPASTHVLRLFPEPTQQASLSRDSEPTGLVSSCPTSPGAVIPPCWAPESLDPRPLTQTPVLFSPRAQRHPDRLEAHSPAGTTPRRLSSPCRSPVCP